MKRALAAAALALLLPAAGVSQDETKPVPPAGFWTDAEKALLDRGLAVLNCTRADLGFQKRPIEDPFRLAVVNRALDDPLSVGNEAQAWDEAARSGDALALGTRAHETLGGPRIQPRASSQPQDAGSAADPLKSALASYIRKFLVAQFHAAAATDALGEGRAAFLRKALLTQVEKPALALDGADLGDDEFRAATARVDLAKIEGSGLDLLAATKTLVDALRLPDSRVERWKGRQVNLPMVIYGYGDDVHDEAADADAAIVLDLGGNDTWTRGAGATVLQKRTISVCIDLAGNDRYVGREDLSFGAALGGVAIQWDCAGDDLYDAGHASLGAGICGVGVLVDEGGDDVYRCRDFGIGAGAFGIGVFLDKGGNDLYHCDLYGEGFASTRGCGVLVDMDGNDVYDAGGAHLHAPLYNDRYQSLSQGFSIGMRPDASGGVGVLVDLKGNDRYTADIYGQGASYWYALGILVDDDGNDTYNLGQYGQGSGIHLSAGILVDRAGSDLYYLKNGVGMGGAHDYSVGMLVDRGGDDYYAGSGGTQGGALTNSVALLFDGGGNDGYAVVNQGGVQGGANWARGTGGIGLLMDAGGADTYSESTRDGAVWTKETVGAGLDEVSEVKGGSGDPNVTTLTPEQAKERVDRDGRTDGADDFEKLWKMACQWEVGDNQKIVPVARERLWVFGERALDRALERVGTKDGLEFRAVEATLAKFPKGEVVARLLEHTRAAEVPVRKGAVRALASLQAAEALDRLVEMLEKDPENRPTVLAALAGLKKAPAAVRGFLRSAKEVEGVQAALCLGAVGDADAIAALLGAMGSELAFPVRLAAVDRLAALGEPAVAGLAALAADAKSPLMARRNAVRALGGSKCPAACVAIEAALKDADPWVRLSARQAGADLVKALGAEKVPTMLPAIEAAAKAEEDPVVRRLR